MTSRRYFRKITLFTSRTVNSHQCLLPMPSPQINCDFTGATSTSSASGYFTVTMTVCSITCGIHSSYWWKIKLPVFRKQWLCHFSELGKKGKVLYPFPQLPLKNEFTLTILIFCSHLLLIYMNERADVENKWRILTTIKYKNQSTLNINYHLNYVNFCIKKKKMRKKQLHDESLQIRTYRSQKAPDNWNWYSSK